MLCPSCNNFRPANNALCPACQAPSPLVSGGWSGSDASLAGSSWNNQNQVGGANSWGGPGNSFNNDWNNSIPSGQLPFAQNSWPDPASSGAQQLAFPTTNQQPNGNENSFWAQSMSPADGQGQQSFLPVPYQAQPSPQSLMVMPNGFPTIGPGIQPVNPLLPALPDGVDEPVYVAPMYTKPRPLIPRYRAISGLLSVIIVMGLLCTGAGYYANATGKLTFLQKMFGNWTPAKISTTQQTLNVPSTQVTPGTIAKLFPSATLGTSIDPDTNFIPISTNQFTVGQTIYLSCTVNPTKVGQIVLKWYTGNNYWKSSTSSQEAKANETSTAKFLIVYAQATEAKVEIYWQDQTGKDQTGNPTFGPLQLGETLLFVVEPKP